MRDMVEEQQQIQRYPVNWDQVRGWGRTQSTVRWNKWTFGVSWEDFGTIRRRERFRSLIVRLEIGPLKLSWRRNWEADR